jgi:hypothetical protein
MPTAKEIELLRLRPNVPVLSVSRITSGKEGQVLQALRIVATADRNVFVYAPSTSSVLRCCVPSAARIPCGTASGLDPAERLRL